MTTIASILPGRIQMSRKDILLSIMIYTQYNIVPFIHRTMLYVVEYVLVFKLTIICIYTNKMFGVSKFEGKIMLVLY